ncbi:hypothetical protein [Nocardia suismassiliense]|uniref:hypothetical protein n=1 Tax=Nocardia suismassiliense TaxID=2077092 RepID=UPI000D1F9175|nr:hypothetical protein [Nocardia suismassiliense]
MTDNNVHLRAFELAGWKARLLDRIADLAARQSLVLHTEYPGYRDGDGRGAAAIEGWRSRLRDLHAIRTELEIRAELVGVDVELIGAAAESGHSELHWNHLADYPLTVAPDDPDRAPLLDAIAEDMWTLEHMAAVEAARQEEQRHFIPDPAAQQQYERNMIALRTRVNRTAATVELTEAEQAEMVHRDHGDWIRLVSRTVYGYSNLELEERWHAYAWPGIEWDARRVNAGPVDDGELTESSTWAPEPGVLISEATRALGVDIDEARVEAFIYGGDVLDHLASMVGSSPGGTAASWGSEPVGEALARPPEFGTLADPE